MRRSTMRASPAGPKPWHVGPVPDVSDAQVQQAWRHYVTTVPAASRFSFVTGYTKPRPAQVDAVEMLNNREVGFWKLTETQKMNTNSYGDCRVTSP